MSSQGPDPFHFERITEGLCPIHGTPLERREACGWCHDCDNGYSLSNNTMSLHFELDDPT